MSQGAAAAGQGAGAGAPLELIAAALRRERRRTGLSLTEVARRAGIAKSTLSQLESGVGNPSLETLWAICVALDVPFSRLLNPPRPHVQVIRADEGPTVSAAQANYQATLLAACPPGARRDVYRIAAEPGHTRASDPHMPGVTEHVVLSAGRATTSPTRATSRTSSRPSNRGRWPCWCPNTPKRCSGSSRGYRPPGVPLSVLSLFSDMSDEYGG